MIETTRIIASRQCPWFRVDLREDDILVFHPKARLVLTHEIALRIVELGMELADRPMPALVLMQEMARVERAARSLFASEVYLRMFCQTALVVGSPVSRVICNFFVALHPLKYPCQIFDDPNLALEWLREFRT